MAAIRLAHQDDLSTAVAGFWLMCLVNLSLPLAIRGTSRAMSRYAADSDADPLTGLLNRRGFGDVLGRLLSSMPTRSGRQLAMLMVDLDDFKRVNDTYGHAAGDRTLRRVADLLRDSTPDDGVVCRAGGEEFLIALPSRSPDVAELAERLCDAVRSNLDGVTASVGVAVARLGWFPGAPDTEIVDRMITAADHAMYEAKRSGGDRVVVTTDHPLADERFSEQ